MPYFFGALEVGSDCGTVPLLRFFGDHLHVYPLAGLRNQANRLLCRTTAVNLSPFRLPPGPAPVPACRGDGEFLTIFYIFYPTDFFSFRAACDLPELRRVPSFARRRPMNSRVAVIHARPLVSGPSSISAFVTLNQLGFDQ